MIDWVSIVRHSRRRFSVLNFAGGGRQRRGFTFHAPKQHHHKSQTITPMNADEATTQSDEKLSSTCCFSNVRENSIFYFIIPVYLLLYFPVCCLPKKINLHIYVKLIPFTR